MEITVWVQKSQCRQVHLVIHQYRLKLDHAKKQSYVNTIHITAIISEPELKIWVYVTCLFSQDWTSAILSTGINEKLHSHLQHAQNFTILLITSQAFLGLSSSYIVELLTPYKPAILRWGPAGCFENQDLNRKGDCFLPSGPSRL